MIQIIGDIDAAAFVKFDAELYALEQAAAKSSLDKAFKKTYIKLMSDGGDATVGLAFFDRIKLSPLHITITAYGQVGSAAVIIFAAGDERLMTPNSSIYLHEETLASEAAPLSNIGKELERLTKLDDQYNELMKRSSNKSELFWQQLSEQETYLNPHDCLEYGLCTEILKYKAKK